jgi:hypothetical protein
MSPGGQRAHVRRPDVRVPHAAHSANAGGSMRARVFVPLFCALTPACALDASGTQSDETLSSAADAASLDASSIDPPALDAAGADGVADGAAAPDTGGVTDGSAPIDAGADAPKPDTSLADAIAGIECGPVTCAPGQLCCARRTTEGVTLACAATCEGGTGFGCEFPAQCGASAPLCCYELVTKPAGPTTCDVGLAGSKCATACTSTAALSCGSPVSLRACAKDADCAGQPASPTCCTVTTPVGPERVCAPGWLKSLPGTTCP